MFPGRHNVHQFQAPGESGGWKASLRLGFHKGIKRTELSERERRGPLSVQRPFYPEGDVCHVYLLHPPGGVVGGDEIAIDVVAKQGSSALVTTPGAAKFYRSAGGVASQVQTIDVHENACLEWLPQENIFFPGARVKLDTRLNLAEGARAALWEIQCFGRPVINEAFENGDVDSRFEISRFGVPLVIDRLRLNRANRACVSLTAANPVVGTLILTGCGPDDVDWCRERIEAHDGADGISITLIDDVLVARYLGADTAFVKAAFTRLWQQLRPRVFAKAAVTPRIWFT